MKIDGSEIKIDVKFDISPVTLGAVFKEKVVVQEVVKMRTESDDDAIVITSVIPVSASGDTISIGGP